MRRILLSLITLAAITVIVAPSALAAPAVSNAAFQRVWDRQDRVVADHISDRS